MGFVIHSSGFLGLDIKRNIFCSIFFSVLKSPLHLISDNHYVLESHKVQDHCHTSAILFVNILWLSWCNEYDTRRTNSHQLTTSTIVHWRLEPPDINEIKISRPFVDVGDKIQCPSNFHLTTESETHFQKKAFYSSPYKANYCRVYESKDSDCYKSQSIS